MTMPSRLKTLPLLAMLVGAPAIAQLTVTSGFDSGASTVGPQAAASQASFLSSTGGRVMLDFEGDLPAGLAIQGGRVTGDSGCRAALCGFNTTEAGSQFLLAPGKKGAITFTFGEGVSYFGAYVSGLQLATGTLTFQDGARQEISLPYGDMSLGGMAFVGFHAPGKLINSVSIYAGNDIIAIDDVVYGRGPVAAVPEAGTLATMGLGLLAVAGVRRARAVPRARGRQPV
jgi:hypothetical protein